MDEHLSRTVRFHDDREIDRSQFCGDSLINAKLEWGPCFLRSINGFRCRSSRPMLLFRQSNFSLLTCIAHGFMHIPRGNVENASNKREKRWTSLFIAVWVDSFDEISEQCFIEVCLIFGVYEILIWLCNKPENETISIRYAFFFQISFKP